MNQINWKIVEAEDDKVTVDFEINSKFVNKISFSWRGDESFLLEEINSSAAILLQQYCESVKIDDPTRRKLLPLSGTIDDSQIRVNEPNATISTNSNTTFDFL